MSKLLLTSEKSVASNQDNLISAKLWYLVKSVHIRQQIPILVARVLFIISTIWTWGYRQRQSGRFMLYNEDATGMSILESAYGAQVCAHSQTHAHTRHILRGLSKQELFFVCNNSPLVSESVRCCLRRWGLIKWDLANGLGATPVCRGVCVCAYKVIYQASVSKT